MMMMMRMMMMMNLRGRGGLEQHLDTVVDAHVFQKLFLRDRTAKAHCKC